MTINQKSCHGAHECLQTSSYRCHMSPLLKIHQKYRSYIVWYVENMGWWEGLKHLFLNVPKPWSRIKNQPLTSKVEAKLSADEETLALKPGELVEVKPIEEILATLDQKRRHKGLRWMTGMRKFCGKKYRVYRRLERIMLESNGELRNMKNTVLLEGVMCDGSEFGGCDRSCFHFWREAWLRRINE